ncbi:MAG TPA: molybdopterin molybdenumtransferase MoeA [Bacteroidales bacterium]|nr:molybdopterin molybdenumtransferase MoeA [Bacteroidales bacterium]
MISFEKAYDIVISSEVLLQTENIELANVLGRVLAQDVHSDMNMPPFDKSAMDGFACREADLHMELEMIEVLAAGEIPKKKIETGECTKIMTGAMIPQGADCVIMVEDTEITAEGKIRYTKIERKNIEVCEACAPSSKKTNKNICFLGEDVKLGEEVLKKGVVLKPQHLPILASAGCANPLVYKKVSVGIIATGSELVEPHEKPGLSQIRNSNASQLVAQVMACGALPNYYGIAEDVEETTKNVLQKAVSENDLVLLTGGVSMGDFDFVPLIMKELGFEILFDSIAVQPGKPTTFAIKSGKFIFGLPGNPVSSFTQFELLTKPLIYKMMGHAYEPVHLKMPLEVGYSRKKADRMSWIPVSITKLGTILPADYHGSAHINSLASAHGFIAVPIGTKELNKGELIDVRQI